MAARNVDENIYHWKILNVSVAIILSSSYDNEPEYPADLDPNADEKKIIYVQCTNCTCKYDVQAVLIISLRS